MSESHFLGVPLPEDTQSVADQRPMSLEEFTAQIERQKLAYWKTKRGQGNVPNPTTPITKS